MVTRSKVLPTWQGARGAARFCAKVAHDESFPVETRTIARAMYENIEEIRIELQRRMREKKGLPK